MAAYLVAKQYTRGTYAFWVSGLDSSYVRDDRYFTITVGGNPYSVAIPAGVTTSDTITASGLGDFTTYSVNWSIFAMSEADSSATVYVDGSTTVTTGGNITIEGGKGGSVSSTVGVGTVFVAYGQSVTMTATPKSGYEFDYWTDNGGGKIYGTSITRSITASETFTAVFIEEREAVTYTLSYDANGGTGAPEAQSGSSKKGYYVFTVTTSVPEREDCAFLGWALGASATTPAYEPGDSIRVTGDTTLYAVWGGLANGVYAGISNLARKVKAAYVGVAGKARKIKKIYIGVNDKARLCYAHCTVAITGSGGTKTSYVVVDGVTYTTPATLDVPAGAVVNCYLYVGSRSPSDWPKSKITVNDTTVFSASSQGLQTAYGYAVSTDCTIELGQISGAQSSTSGIIKITE